MTAQSFYYNIALIYTIIFLLDMVFWYFAMWIFADKLWVKVEAKVRAFSLVASVITALISFAIMQAIFKMILISYIVYLVVLAFSMRYSLEYFWDVEKKFSMKIVSNTSLTLIVITIVSNLVLSAMLLSTVL